MKTLTIKLTLLVILISTTNSYAQSAFEIAGYVTGGGTLTFPTEENTRFIESVSTVNPLSFISGNAGLALSGAVQTGIYLDLEGTFSGMSFLIDASFSYVDTRSSAIITNTVLATNFARVITKTSYFSIGVGALIKFHFFKNFSWGIGGGIYLTPFEYTLEFERISADNSTNNIASIVIPNATTFVPYAKTTLEYSIFFTGNLTMRVGGYFSFELPTLFLADSPGTLSQYLNAGAILGLGYLFRFY